jgi:pyridoxal phosphate enzyme (YggS family)
MSIIQNYLSIKNYINNLDTNIDLIVVTKNQEIDNIKILLDHGHLSFGENKVQDAISKWDVILKNYKNINLHLIGKLQSNKAKEAFNIFNCIHSLDNEKLANIFSNLEKSNNKHISYFIQVNLGNESQKNGIQINLLPDFIKYCRLDLKLNILGLMCIPPANQIPDPYFKKLKDLNEVNNFKYLSMGMSSDFKSAISLGSTHVRIGSAIFN